MVGLDSHSLWLPLLVFAGASALMLWRLEALGGKGFEGTVLGTLIMPYCSGVGNLVFAYVMSRERQGGAEVIINCLVNNTTNLTLLIGLPAVIWGAARAATRKKPARTAVQTAEINRLSLLLTLVAGLFFLGAVWALGRDGTLNFGDGLVLVGGFLFWQCFHIFEVLKSNVRKNRSLSWTIYPELLVLLAGAGAVYWSVHGLVAWLEVRSGGWLANHVGWLSGWLMVLPNALLALYYGWRGRAEVVYASQVGDGHICIPLCIGLTALLAPARMPGVFDLAALLLAGALATHLLCVAVFGRLPRFVGWAMLAGYAGFLWKGFPG